MALPTYLDLVNDVLVRLREPEVSTVNENNLSKLIGKFINDAKRQVEDSYSWNALTKTLTAVTTPGTFHYTLVGTQHRFKVIDIFNVSSRSHMKAATNSQMSLYLLGSDSVQTGNPQYYCFNGVDPNGDTQVDVFPVPDGEYQIFFNLYDPQPDLSSDSNTLEVPAEPVIQLAYARALVERGEDTGLQSSEAYALFKQVLSDYIAIEQSRYPEEETWVVT